MPFTLEELAEMAAADAEIEAAALTLEDYRETDDRDREVRMERKGPKGKKVAAQQKAYREANREKVAAQQKAYREANREKVGQSGESGRPEEGLPGSQSGENQRLYAGISEE